MQCVAMTEDLHQLRPDKLNFLMLGFACPVLSLTKIKTNFDVHMRNGIITLVVK